MRMINKKSWLDELYVVAVAGILLLLMFFWFSPGHGEKLNMMYLWPLSAAVIAATLARGDARPHRCTIVSFVLTGWFWLTCVLGGDPYLILNARFMLGIALAFGVAYPLFLVVDKKLCSARFTALAALYVLMALTLAVLSLYAAVTGTEFSTPLSELTLGIREWRLYAFDYHPNDVACLLSIGLALSLWLCFALKRKPLRALPALAALVIYMAISLTTSYTVMVTVTFAVGFGSLIVAARFIRAKSRAAKTALCCLTALCVAAVVFFCFTPALNLVKWAECLVRPQRVVQVEEPATAEQAGAEIVGAPMASAADEAQGTAPAISGDEVIAVDIIGDLFTVSTRVEIWKAGLKYLRERPITLLIGSLDSVVARVPMRYGQEQVFHLHNIWLEVLLLAGVPGLIMFVWLCLMALRGSLALALAADVPLYRRLLAVLPPMLMLNGMMEVYPGIRGNVVDIMYAVICGAVIRLGDEALGQNTLRQLVRGHVSREGIK